MLSKDELIKRITEAGKIRRWYQDIPYGEILPSAYSAHHFSDGKTNERSYGEGRWTNYIRPMIETIKNELDTPHAILSEVGCSAGLFLLRAWQQFGFRRLIGIEAAEGGYQQLLITRDYYDQMPLLAYHVAIGQAEPNIYNPNTAHIGMDKFPIADLTLMSCVHYHIRIEDLIDYLKKLSSKTLYLAVLTDENATDISHAGSVYFEGLMAGIGGWIKISDLKTPVDWLAEKRTDRCKNLTGLIFKSRLLKRLNVNDCFRKQLNHNEYSKEFYSKIFPPFIDDVLAQKVGEWNHGYTQVFDWQRNPYHGSTAWSIDKSSARVLSYINIILSMKEHGQEQPIGLQEHLNLVDPWDGFHRIAVLNHLGVKYVYGKDVIPKCSVQM